jgi:predicted ATPase
VLAQIEERLRDPACRLLTLVGPGGSGKTRLALEAAARQVGRYPDGVFFVPLASLRAAEGIVPAVGQAVGMPVTALPGVRLPDLRQQLLDYLRRKQVLLVLDNAEHLLRERLTGVAAIATGVLRAAPKVVVLVTSRVALNVQGEYTHPIGGMDVPPLLPPAGGREAGGEGRYSAVKLFLDSARRVKPDFGLTAEVLPDVARICRLVEGMPLGIVLAAPWVRVLSAAEIADEVERSYDFLQARQGDVPDRQRSVRAAFEHSWGLLAERQRAVLAALSVFHGGWKRDAAERVAGATAEDLATLVDHSLLERGPGGRFDLHRLLRQYAAEKLALSVRDEEAVRERHCAYYVAALEHWGVDLVPALWSQPGIAEVAAEAENARAAWQWAVDRVQVCRLARAVKGLWTGYLWRGPEEGERVFGAAVDALAEKEGRCGLPALGLEVWSQLLAAQGYFGVELGHWEAARERLRRSAALLRDPRLAGRDTREARALVLLVEGHLRNLHGDLYGARERLEGSLALYRALGRYHEMAGTLNLLGNVLEALGAYPEAESLQREAVAILRASGDRAGLSGGLTFWAATLRHLGRLEEAERLAREGVAIAEEIGEWSCLAFALGRLGLVLKARGKYGEAWDGMERCLATLDETGVRILQALAHAHAGGVLVHQGRYQEARACGSAAVALGRELDFPWGIGVGLLTLGQAAAAQKAYDEARHRLRESEVILGRIHHHMQLYVLVCTALVERAQGHRRAALQSLREALGSFTEVPRLTVTLDALAVGALLTLDAGDAERAVERYALALRYPYVAHSRYYQDVVGVHIAAAAAALPQDVVAVAEERSRARDLWVTVEELLAELEEQSVQDC